MDAVSFDEYGMKEVKCWGCHEVVIHRSYTMMQSRADSSKTIPVMCMQRLSNHLEISVKLSNGTWASIPYCKTCKAKPLDAAHLSQHLTDGWAAEMEASGKSAEQISAMRNKHINLKIVGLL